MNGYDASVRRAARISTLIIAGSIAVLAAFVAAAPPLKAASTAPASLFSSSIVVVVNPSGMTPLAALAEFQTSVPCSVSVKIEGSLPVYKAFIDNSTSHSIPILGLYAGQANTVTITAAAANGRRETKTVTVATAPLPAEFPDIVIETADPSRMEPGMNVSTLVVTVGNGGRTYPIFFDANGDIRWYLDLSRYAGLCLAFERTRNGNFIFGFGDSIFEYDLLGRLVSQFSFPGYNFHHDVREEPNGNLIGTVDKEGTTIVNSHGLIPSREDIMIEVDRQTGAILTELDMRKILQVDRNEQINANGDWFHMNGIWYSPDDDTFIISGRHQGVVKVGRDNSVKWILAAHRGWSHSGADNSGPDPSPFLLTAVDAAGNPYEACVQDGSSALPDFDWTWGQHAPVLLSNGDLFVFDNGFERNFSLSGPYYSRAVQYHLDEAAQTIRQIWEYGLERGEETFSSIISSVDSLPLGGNRIMAPGVNRSGPRPYAKVVEVTVPDKQVIFEATLYFKNLHYTGNATLPGGFDIIFRSHRISLYPDTDWPHLRPDN